MGNTGVKTDKKLSAYCADNNFSKAKFFEDLMKCLTQDQINKWVNSSEDNIKFV